VSDRELLELAAKAARIEVTPHPNGKVTPQFIFLADGRNWNPLTDDGDALRLAVKLGLTIQHLTANEEVVVSSYSGSSEAYEFYLSDPYAATRRAIVRAAAEIGRAMP
jgi:hypothetical protein